MLCMPSEYFYWICSVCNTAHGVQYCALDMPSEKFGILAEFPLCGHVMCSALCNLDMHTSAFAEYDLFGNLVYNAVHWICMPSEKFGTCQITFVWKYDVQCLKYAEYVLRVLCHFLDILCVGIWCPQYTGHIYPQRNLHGIYWTHSEWESGVLQLTRSLLYCTAAVLKLK